MDRSKASRFAKAKKPIIKSVSDRKPDPQISATVAETLLRAGVSLRKDEVYEKTGYLIAVTNLSNYCTGVKRVKNVDIARHFAETLGVSIIDVL